MWKRHRNVTLEQDIYDCVKFPNSIFGIATYKQCKSSMATSPDLHIQFYVEVMCEGKIYNGMDCNLLLHAG